MKNKSGNVLLDSLNKSLQIMAWTSLTQSNMSVNVLESERNLKQNQIKGKSIFKKWDIIKHKNGGVTY